MSRSEFRWNKKRKHYAYLFKDKGAYVANILLSSKSEVKDNRHPERKIIIKNIKLFRHPSNKDGIFYIVARCYLDHIDSFDKKIYTNWKWNKNDKRKIKRIKKSWLRYH